MPSTTPCPMLDDGVTPDGDIILILTNKELLLLEQKYKSVFTNTHELWDTIGPLMLRLGSAYVQMSEEASKTGKRPSPVALAFSEFEIKVAVHLVSSFDAIMNEMVGIGLLTKCYAALLHIDTEKELPPGYAMLGASREEVIYARDSNEDTSEDNTDNTAGL